MTDIDNTERAGRIKMIITDVDGTLTDGTLILFPDGEEVKSYNVLDGMGMLLAHLAGIKTGIITGKYSKPLAKRAKNLKVSELYQGILDKKKVLFEILKKHDLHLEDVAYIGDDLGDLDVIKIVGFAAAVANAHAVIKEHSHYHCRLGGGQGAVREFIEFILTVQDKWGLIQDSITNIKGNREMEKSIIGQ
ncbi:MAG: HAD hydrolase family protein [Candidatus Aminicenantes bacterium]|nr:HAD hydrolase family protein [Candidatus Aminicenantes bacterium]